jgi:hypothetical protein
MREAFLGSSLECSVKITLLGFFRRVEVPAWGSQDTVFLARRTVKKCSSMYGEGAQRDRREQSPRGPLFSVCRKG